MRARGWIGWLSAGVTLALFVTLAVVAGGFDARETPREEAGVWVARSAGQYARVNTLTAEIDAVRQVENPSGVVQAGAMGMLLTQGHSRAWPIDAADPADLSDDPTGGAGAAVDAAAELPVPAAAPETTGAGDAIRTPEGTSEVHASRDAVLFRTEAGQAYLAAVDPAAEQGLGPAQLLDPFAGQSTGDVTFRADAVAFDTEAGLIGLFTANTRTVRWFDVAASEFRRGVSDVPETVPGDAQFAIVAGSWVLFDAESGNLWREREESPAQLDTEGVALLQFASGDAAGTDALVADEGGLWSVSSAGATSRVAVASGVPARPVAIGADRVAAWIGGASAQMWTQTGGLRELELDAAVELPGEIEPAIHSNGSRAVLAEVRTGMLWRVPDGQLIPVAQWQLVTPPTQEVGAQVTEDIAEQQPPVAAADAFGVRSGEPASLPVLLNDFDPNRRDVLTIVPESLGDEAGTGLDANFGTVQLLGGGQELTLQPSPEATGSSSFTYRVTDGQSVSEPATVTVTIADDAITTAPEWCPVVGCQRDWPAPELAPGGTLVLPILEGWVDAEGDPMVLAGAVSTDPEAPLRVLVTADGKLAVRHLDPAAADGEATIRVTVADARGESRERELRVGVRTGATLEFASIASTVQTGVPTVLRPLERVTGGSGSFELRDAAVQQGALDLTVGQGTGTLTVTAPGGGALVSVTIRDTVTGQEVAGTIRITAGESLPALALPPLRAFVRPLADTTVDVLDAIPGAASRGLSVQSAVVVDGRMRADVIEHSRVRVSGASSDGQPGRIGSVEVVVREGDETARGRLTVFQIPASSSGTIAVPDTATVRVGSVVDIPVLENDVAPPGERLVLHPEVAGAGDALAFASGSLVRYLAPSIPGTYTLSYTTYGASSPELGDTAQVTITVLPAGANRDPHPPSVTVRLAPGETVQTEVPLSGVDPDGDRVRLVSVQEPEDSQVVAQVQPRTGVVQIEASPSASRGVRFASYTVRDSGGGEATGSLRIIVTDPDASGGAPVVYSDYVRIARGTGDDAVVRPLDNDIDPSGGVLELVSVEPNVPGGESSPEYAVLAARIDLDALESGVVRIAGGDELGTVSYRYSVRSRVTGSTADGLIVVQVSERVGLQAPRVTDTVLAVRDRVDFAAVGVDVVEGRVSWATGDVAALDLSLWGEAADRYRVSGNRILGEYRAEGDLVPFRLSGIDTTGAEVVGYGFLVVPPLDELRLSLKSGTAPLSVNEGDSVTAELRSMLDLSPGDQIVIGDGAFATQRDQATCTAVSGSSVRYTAGQGEPWSDTCTVRVRLIEQTTFTALPLSVRIVPREPVAQLRPLTRTVAPGATETIALGSMVEWQGGRQGQMDALRFTASGGGVSFQVNQSGPSLTVQALSGATPGAQEQITVTVTGAGESQAILTLRVGEAATDAPRGAAVALTCTVGTACSTELVGQAGEYDPFAGRPGGGLRLVAVDAAACVIGSFRVVGNAVQVSWAEQRVAGGTCEVTFTVRDAQNREGVGTLSFEALGVPPAPALVEQVGYSETGVTLRVSLGEAQNAYPSLQGVVIRQDGAAVTATCTPAGATFTCEVGGLTLGTQHQFSARAVNAVGESVSSAAATGWAYRTPATPTASAMQEGAGSTAEQGTVRVRISGGSDVQEYQFLLNGAAFAALPGATVDTTLQVPVGEHRFSVLPVSRFPHPLNQPNTGESTPPEPLIVAGPPIIRSLTLESEPGSTTVLATVDLFANWGVDTQYGIVDHGACVARDDWDDYEPAVFTGVPGEEMVVTVCATNEWGDAAPVTRQIIVGGT
ncbi:Ig-like domain-containing protein [Leucobacter sp. W1038]|uniref:Ig-like domain-containing protein n=1 Tax=Leucobacter sp. W1038 TaxID=3438281 RepID=UPI003D973219